MTTQTLQNYEGAAEVLFGNQALAEATSISVNDNANRNPVRTMKKGVAGYSEGAYESEITIENAVPKAGLEFDYLKALIEGEFITITYLEAGQRYSYEVWCETVERSRSTDSAASLTVNCRGAAPRIS